jgi:hypothetical protein
MKIGQKYLSTSDDVVREIIDIKKEPKTGLIYVISYMNYRGEKTVFEMKESDFTRLTETFNTWRKIES